VISLEIFESFRHVDFVLNGKGNYACTGIGVIKCQRGKIVSVDLGSPQFPISLI